MITSSARRPVSELEYARARDPDRKKIHCPRCRTWLFEVYSERFPYLYCTTCEWWSEIKVETDEEQRIEAPT